MSYTCADCKYHICRNGCMTDRICENYCTKKKAKSVCYNSKCKEFEFEGIKHVANLF